MTKLALIGYGKMGKMIATQAAQLPVEIVAIIDPAQEGCAEEINQDTLKDAEVCIEFSHPSVVSDNIQKVCNCGRNLVVGTTGWGDKLEEVRKLVEAAGIGMVYGSNMSIGMNLFYEVVKKAANLFAAYDNYDVYGLELHHRQKADSPSGTAIELTKILLAEVNAKLTALFEKADRKISEDELHFASIRAGWIPGTHTIGFDSEADTIELTHRARNRSGLAWGALKAALWIRDKKGLYTFQDFLKG
jgi:4-hydroxy-tetrahydrodipicolinate reductase